MLINGVLLVFNILPIYPLDGGKILQCLLWFPMRFTKSMRIASLIGLVCAVGAILYLLKIHASTYLMLMGAFLALEAYNGFRMAQQLASEGQR